MHTLIADGVSKGNECLVYWIKQGSWKRNLIYSGKRGIELKNLIKKQKETDVQYINAMCNYIFSKAFSHI